MIQQHAVAPHRGARADGNGGSSADLHVFPDANVVAEKNFSVIRLAQPFRNAAEHGPPDNQRILAHEDPLGVIGFEGIFNPPAAAVSAERPAYDKSME